MVIDIPDFLTTKICFGGADLTTAYVTFGRGGRVVMFDGDEQGLPLAF